MKPSQTIVKQSDAIKAAAKRHGFSNLRVFGPVSRGEDSESSILYILGEALEQATPLSQTKLERELNSTLNTNVIILTESALPKHMAAEVAKGTIPI
jgi:predicted nucleotidyltransferase